MSSEAATESTTQLQRLRECVTHSRRTPSTSQSKREALQVCPAASIRAVSRLSLEGQWFLETRPTLRLWQPTPSNSIFRRHELSNTMQRSSVSSHVILRSAYRTSVHVSMA